MSAYLVSLDPGLRGSGVAWWAEDGSLLFVDYLRNPVKKGDGPGAWVGFDLLPLYAGQAAPLIQHRRAEELMRELAGALRS